MESSFDWYASVARRYRYLAQHDSPEAAAIMAEIQAAFGSHAAMRDGIALAFTKTEVQQNGGKPEVSMYRLLLESYPKAVPLFERALALCLPYWNRSGTEALPMQEDALSNPDARAFLTPIAYSSMY